MASQTDEDRKHFISAYLFERNGLEVRLAAAEDEDERKRLKANIKGVDKELQRLGHEGKPPAKRASRTSTPTRTKL